MRILLAEDNPRARSVKAMLDRAGHLVVRVTTGAEAFANFQSEPFPVVIADLAMPDGDGYALCRAIRARAQAEYVYVILLVSEGEQFRFPEAEAAEVDDVLTLPIAADVLQARLRVAKRILTLYEEVDRLRGLIPICAYCKKIRQEQGLWQQMEAYISAHSRALFTHTICPECGKREFGDYARAAEEKDSVS